MPNLETNLQALKCPENESEFEVRATREERQLPYLGTDLGLNPCICS